MNFEYVCVVQVTERDLRLTYFPQFKACIDAGTYNLMCSYYRLALFLTYSTLFFFAEVHATF